MTRQRFTLVIEDAAGPHDAPAVVRLRQVLKRLLRTYGFRCTKVVEEFGPSAPPARRPSSARPATGMDPESSPD